MDEARIDARDVRRSFDRAAAGYDGAAVLQATTRRELLARLEYVTLDPVAILDLGAGTGHSSRALQDRYRRAMVIALDLAEGMLRQARRQQPWLRRFARVCGNASRLPLRDASVDLVFSNMALHWCSDLDRVLAEIRRVLRPGGLVNLTVPGPDTLRELRTAWAAADGANHVNAFMDMHDLGEGLMRAGLAEPVLDVERITLTYPDLHALMRDLKVTGAHNVTAGRPRGLMGRRRLERVAEAYEQFRRDGVLPATCEVVFAQAWGPDREPVRARRSGEFAVPVGTIGRRPRDGA
jgi:malonyl-CoA O-methyltransferase